MVIILEIINTQEEININMQHPIIGIILMLLALGVIGWIEGNKAKKQAKKMHHDKSKNSRYKESV